VAPRSEWVEAKRRKAWALGIQHRENLVHRYLTAREGADGEKWE